MCSQWEPEVMELTAHLCLLILCIPHSRVKGLSLYKYILKAKVVEMYIFIYYGAFVTRPRFWDTLSVSVTWPAYTFISPSSLSFARFLCTVSSRNETCHWYYSRVVISSVTLIKAHILRTTHVWTVYCWRWTMMYQKQ